MASNQYGVVFNGRRITHPGAYDAEDATATTVVTAGSLNTPIVIGNADAGQPGVVQWFTSSADLHNALGSGDAVVAGDLMFSPVPEGGGGASIIGVIVANANTQASVTAGGATYTALNYGQEGNRIQVKVEDGSVAGSKKFTAFRWDTNYMEVEDSIGAILNISYTGAQAYADVTVTQVSGVATAITTHVGATAMAATADLSLDLTSGRFNTIQDVADYINSVSNYVATYVNYNRDFDLPVGSLDATVAPVVITGANGGYLMALKADLAHFINNNSSLVTVNVTGAIVDFPFTYLTNGATGIAPTSWVTYLDTVKKQFSDILVILSSSESIHAEALTHVQEMMIRNQKQMLFTGGAVGEATELVKQRAATLNSDRAVLAYPGIYAKAVNGGKTVLAPYFTAALIAGRVCGVDASEPITFDYFDLIGLEVDMLAGDPDIDDLVNSGVATLERVQNGAIRLVQGITTYLGANNPLYREISVRRGADKVANSMRQAMEDAFVGKKGIRATASAVQTKATDVLDQAVSDGDITAYQNIVVRFDGTAVYVDYQVAPVEPINFILDTAHFVPDSSIPQQSDSNS